jgi:hypothetical protein
VVAFTARVQLDTRVRNFDYGCRKPDRPREGGVVVDQRHYLVKLAFVQAGHWHPTFTFNQYGQAKDEIATDSDLTVGKYGASTRGSSLGRSSRKALFKVKKVSVVSVLFCMVVYLTVVVL